LISAALDWIFPPRCGLCGAAGPEAICSVCLGGFERKPVELLARRGELDYAAAVFDYSNRAEQAVKRLKYERITPLAKPMSQLLWEHGEALGLFDVDAIVPVPIHWQRRFERGFNQAELLCSELPSNLVKAGLMRRVKATRPQYALTAEQREENLRNAFAADTSGARLLLIDDVFTSGYTARECARALKAAGAAQVGLLAFASGGA